MLTFIKAQLSAILATLVDWLITFTLGELEVLPVLYAGIAGAVGGGIFNFTVNRIWAFNSRNEKVSRQMMKYILIWLGYLTLFTFGYYLLTDPLQIDYMLAKVGLSVFLGVTYNFLLHKYFVFIIK